MAIPLYKLIDKWIGTPLAWLLGNLISKSSKESLPGNPQKIMIIKLWAIGDSIVMLPMISALRQRFPKAEIDILCRDRNKEVFECVPGITSIRLLESGKGGIRNLLSLRRNYDIVLDGEPYLRLSALLAFYLGKTRIGWGGSTRSKLYTHTVPFDRSKHMVRNYVSMAELLGGHYDGKTLVQPTISDMDRRHVTMAFESRGIQDGDYLVAASPSVAESSKSRQWMPERFAETLDAIAKQRKATILFIGSRSDLPAINDVRNRMKLSSITLAGQLNLAQTFEALSRCKLAVSVDTGPMHAAAAVGVPTIGLFGPNIPTLWAPYGPAHKAIYHAVECSPCIINEKGQMPDCLRKTDKYLCMKKITVDEVLKAVEELHATRHANPANQPSHTNHDETHDGTHYARNHPSMLHGKHSHKNPGPRPSVSPD